MSSTIQLRRALSGHVAARCVAVVVVVIAGTAYSTTASAQQQKAPPAARPAAARQPLAIRAFGDLGLTRFAAADTFEATLGSPSGVLFGGGVEVVTPRRIFANIRISHFQKSGERVFVDDDGEVFPLGLEMQVGVTPIEISGGYRFRPRGRTGGMIPYAGGGIGWHRYSEESEFADSGEDVSETLTGYHALGGIEFRRGRSWAVAGELQWTVVPNAFGDDVSSAAAAFDETNLGGFGFRVRVVFGH